MANIMLKVFAFVAIIMFSHILKISAVNKDESNGFLPISKREVVATDPNNIRFIIGNTQLFPIPKSEESLVSKLILVESTTTKKSALHDPEHVTKNDTTSEFAVDAENKGGTHQNTVSIGGIQNFGGDIQADIAKIIVDKENEGGTHQNNVAIGGILNFN